MLFGLGLSFPRPSTSISPTVGEQVCVHQAISSFGQACGVVPPTPAECVQKSRWVAMMMLPMES